MLRYEAATWPWQLPFATSFLNSVPSNSVWSLDKCAFQYWRIKKDHLRGLQVFRPYTLLEYR